MENDYNITELGRAVDYANGKCTFVEAQESLKRLRTLYSHVSKKVFDELGATAKKATTLQMRNDRLQDAKKTSLDQGNFTELGFDSLEIAQALRWCLINQTEPHSDLQLSSIVSIVYEIYASWLGSHGERIIVEHPQAQRKGPIFWRIWNQVPKKGLPTYEDYASVAERNAGVAKMISNAAKKYATYPIEALNRFHRNNEAYRNADDKHNGGKWNKELDDRDIYLWRKNK